MTSVVKTNERTSTTGQKFWPLKKFGLNNGRGTDQPISPPPIESKHKDDSSTVGANAAVANEMEKKSKNKRLSSLLSSRRQGAIQNLQSHENTPEAIAADNTTKKYSSQTPTINRKTGREIKTKTQQRHSTVNLTAKSAGSGALTRANSVFNTTTNNNNNNNNNKQRATKVNTRHSSDDKTKPSSRPHSPPTKRNESPAILNEKEAAKKPTILDESKKNIINEDKSKKPSVHDSKKPEDKSKKVEERLTKKEVEKKQHEEEEKQIPSVSTSSSSSISSIQFHHNSYQQQEKENPPVSITELISKVMAQEEQTQHYEQGEYEHEESRLDHDSGIIKEYQTSPLLSPPSTPAAVPPCQYSAASENEYVTKKGEEGEYFDEEFEEVEDDEGEEEQQHYYHNNHYYQQSNHNQYQQQQQQQQNRSGVLIHSEPVSPTLYTFDAQSVQPRPYEIDKVQQPSFVQPIQRIQRLRPAASFATLRQLANHNGSTGQLNQLKRRPVSFIESTAATTTHASASVAEDYLTVRPVYSRRASHEDQSHHIRQQSDNVLHHRLSSPPSVPSSRRLVRSNTVQNVIIKDGQGHRIVQYLGPTSPPLQPQLRRKKIASFESHDSFFSDSTASSNNGWTRRQNEYEQVYQPVFDDTSSSDSGSQRCKRRIKRRDSARSLNHGFESAKCEQLQNKLEKERATVKVLQKQKEACNKDISFLSQNIDTLTAENLEWKRKYEAEKLSREKFQDELSSTMDNLNEATEQIRQLENKNRTLKEEVDQKMLENRELEKKKSRTKLLKDGKSGDRLIAAQLQHSQNQVRLLKSTMEQFLRMGVFSDDHLQFVSPTSSIETVVSELRSGRSRHRRTAPPPTTPTNKSAKAEEKQPESVKKSESNSKQETKQETKQEQKPLSEKKDDELTTAELDLRLRELLREKEILQAEYSKAPSSGGNAIVRRRREELESRLDNVDSQMCRIKLKIRNRII